MKKIPVTAEYERICKLCLQPFAAPTRNTLYCADCKEIVKDMNRKKHRILYKESDIGSRRQKIIYRFDYYIYRSQKFQRLSNADKAGIIKFRDEFVRISRKMLWKYFGLEKGGGVRFDLADEIRDYLEKSETRLNVFLEKHN